MRRTIAIVCFFLSGCAGLIYEVGWIRHASLIFGSTTLALSSVLAVFFGGLALGSAWFGGIAQRTTQPLRLYARLELGLAALAAASPLAFALAETAYEPLYRALSGNLAALFAARLLLVALVLLPPTVLMGGTLPLFCRQFAVREKSLAGTIGFLYGVNTLGAAAGTAAAGFLLIPRLGLQGSLLTAAALNVTVGLVMLRLPLAPAATPAERPRRDAGAQAGARSSAPSRTDLAAVGALFFVTGLVALGAEVLWTRFLALVVRNTVYTYTITLTVVLMGIVLGSLIAARLFDRAGARAVWFGALQAAAALSVLALLFLPPGAWRALGQGAWPYVVLMLPPAALSGALFPLAGRMALADASLAAVTVGRLGALNTVGGIVGALATGFFLLPQHGLATSARVLTGLGLASAWAAWWLLAGGGRRRRAALGLATAATAALWLLLPGLLGTRLPADFLAPRGQLLAWREGWSANLAVVRDRGARQLNIDRLWQGRDRKSHQIMAAHVPMLLHPAPRAVLVVGVGTGQTAARFLMYDIARLDAVDIEPALFPFVAAHFDAAWMRDPRVALIPDDGRTFVAHAAARYDLISVEVGQVFRPGVEAFYTREFYREAAERLAPGGLLAQFVPVGFLRPDDTRRVVATFRERFPECVLWYNAGELLLIGARDGPVRLTPQRLALLTGDPRVRDDLRWTHWGGEPNWQNRPESFLAGFLCGPRGLADLSAGAAAYVDDHPALAYATSAVRPAQRNEAANAELISRHLQPVATIMAAPPAPELAEEVARRRDRNVRDIVALSWLGLVGELRGGLGQSGVTHALAEALRLNPDNPDANQMWAEALVLGGRLADAEPFFAAAWRLDPEDLHVQRGLALVYVNTGRPGQAIPLLQDVLRKDPYDAASENYLGAALAGLGRFAEAIARFEAALRLDPGYRDAQTNLARAREEAARGR